jgi:dihydrodipicolinate synthase/N-acetylneuraminate lyase
LAVEQGRPKEALELYRRLYAYLTVCEATGKFVQVAKLGLELRGRRAGGPRAPLLRLDPEFIERTRLALHRATAATA